MQGLASPVELAQSAAEKQMPALALTDNGFLTGAVEFYDACQNWGVRPILGLESTVLTTFPKNTNHLGFDEQHPTPGKLVLLAQDLTGWSNLCRLSSLLQTEAPAGILLEQLAQFQEGLICLSGGRRGFAAESLAYNQTKLVETAFEKLKNIFSGRLYMELQVWRGSLTPQDRSWAAQILRLAKRMDIPALATVEIHYLLQSSEHLHKLVSAIRQNVLLNDLTDQGYAMPGSYFMDEQEIQQGLERYPLDQPERLLETTLDVADRCQVRLPLGERHYPQYTPQDAALDATVLLRQRAEQGAITLYGSLDGDIQARLDHELETIETCGYASLFLIMQDILQYARRAGVPFSSRGSAASSLVAHCLGITSPDPIGLNLYFERFLNPARVTPPDIDTDLCSRRRDRVIQYVYDRFGNERVAMVATISRLRERSALRETAKAYGLSPSQINNLLDKLPHRWYEPIWRSTDETEVYADLFPDHPEEKFHAIFQDAQALLGLPHHLSIHPGGIVVAPGNLTDLAPVQLAPKGITITQFDLSSIERLGLLKMDLLGIRGLTVLGDVAEVVSEETAALDFLESIPLEDEQTSQTVQEGRTIGCFQIESPGMRATLKEINARSLDDIMVALALYRPGPLTGGLKAAFVERYRAESGSTGHRTKNTEDFYLHPALRPLLQETYGVILYQEQVLQIAHELAGFSLSDADLLRRAMSHFDLDKQMLILKNKFIEGAYQKSRVPEVIANRIWELMAAFAGYGFPKAHAASYAEIGWRAAWCKTHYPALFMAAVLANWGGYYSQRVYLTEAKRMGLGLRPPHINYARQEFSVSYIAEKPVLFMGLGQVRELTQRTISKILRERPFSSFEDFMTRVNPRAKEAQNLIRTGCLDGFGSIPVLLERQAVTKWRAGQLPLFSEDIFAETTSNQIEWTIQEQVAAQNKLLGVSLAAHPLELAAEQIRSSGAVTTVDAAGQLGKSVRVAGTRQTWRRSRTQRDEPIYFMSLEDLDGMLDVIISNEVYKKYRRDLQSAGPYIIEGVVDLNQSNNEPNIRAVKISRIES